MAEFVRDYPRPPLVEPSECRIRVVLGGETVVDSRRAHRVLETSHPPVYYVPLEDVLEGTLEPVAGRTTFCDWKGHRVVLRRRRRREACGARRMDLPRAASRLRGDP